MKTQFDTKLKELNINHYSIPDGQLERLQAFIDEFSGDKDFGKNQSTFIYLRADALANTGAHEEAIAVFNQLYQDETYIFPTLIAQRIAEQLLLIKRENEALTLIEEALRRETRPVDRLPPVLCTFQPRRSRHQASAVFGTAPGNFTFYGHSCTHRI